jgi:DNA-binding transcriptional regulator YiaG
MTEETGHAPTPTFAEWVTRLRDHLHMTQVEFAAELGVAPSTVSRWETGDKTPVRWLARSLEQLAKRKKFPEPMPQ